MYYRNMDDSTILYSIISELEVPDHYSHTFIPAGQKLCRRALKNTHQYGDKTVTEVYFTLTLPVIVLASHDGYAEAIIYLGFNEMKVDQLWLNSISIIEYINIGRADLCDPYMISKINVIIKSLDTTFKKTNIRFYGSKQASAQNDTNIRARITYCAEWSTSY